MTHFTLSNTNITRCAPTCGVPKIKISGINPYVDVPEPAVKALGGGPKARVLVKVERAGAKEKDWKTLSPEKKVARDANRLKAIGRLSPGGWFRSTLVPLRSEPTRLYLDRWMRDSAELEVGEWAQNTLKLDLDPRELPVPDPLRQALDQNRKAKEAWEALAPSRRREILSYLNFLKTPEALERNVRKTIDDLVSN
jgi:hypothetical protein